VVSPARMLLVHGAFHGGWCWDRLVPALRERGVEAEAIDLPLTGLTDDARTVSEAVGRLDRPLVVVGHSYGGAVITAGATGGRDGRAPDHLVYVAALMQDPVEELNLAPTPGLSAVRVGDDGMATVDPVEGGKSMYNRCPPEIVEWAVSRFRPMQVGGEASARPDAVAWRTVSSTYIVCGDDRSIDPEDQRRMAKLATNQIEIDADHSPFCSKVDELADILADIAGSAVAR
jgi:pimeloyl-ACP methyl ester carboxylesterase